MRYLYECQTCKWYHGHSDRIACFYLINVKKRKRYKVPEVTGEESNLWTVKFCPLDEVKKK